MEDFILSDKTKSDFESGFQKPMKKEKCWIYKIDSDKHPTAKEVIDLSSGKVYGSLKTACLDLKIKYSSMLSKISTNGKGKNDTSLMYLCELKELPNQIKINIGNKDFTFNSEIQNNWIKIESENDLPMESKNYWVVNAEGKIVEMEYFTKHKSFTEEEITHYQPIIKPLKPIY